MPGRFLEQAQIDRIFGEQFAAAAAQYPFPITAEAVWEHPSLQNLEPGDHERALNAALDLGLVALGPMATSIVVDASRLPKK